MTIGEFIQKKLDEHNLNDLVQDKNLDYNWVEFSKIDRSKDAMNFANFVAECELVSIRGNKDGGITCWF